MKTINISQIKIHYAALFILQNHIYIVYISNRLLPFLDPKNFKKSNIYILKSISISEKIEGTVTLISIPQKKKTKVLFCTEN